MAPYVVHIVLRSRKLCDEIWRFDVLSCTLMLYDDDTRHVPLREARMPMHATLLLYVLRMACHMILCHNVHDVLHDMCRSCCFKCETRWLRTYVPIWQYGNVQFHVRLLTLMMCECYNVLTTTFRMTLLWNVAKFACVCVGKCASYGVMIMTYVECFVSM